MQKMPNKHISAHLKKTELACRLHYHQLARGNHRRKRAGSTSTATSTVSNSSTSSGHSLPQYPLPGQGGYAPIHGSPAGYSSMSPGGYPTLSTSPPRVQHKVLLPKPRTLTPDD